MGTGSETTTGAGEGIVVEFSADMVESSLEELSDAGCAGGSGKCSRPDLLQRGHTQSRDLRGNIWC